MSDGLREKAISGAKWRVLATYASQLVQAAGAVVLAWLLDKTDYGLMAGAMAVVSLIRGCTSLGINYAIVQRRDRVQEAVNTGLVLSLAAAALGYLALLVVGPFTKAYALDKALLLALGLLSFLRPVAMVTEGSLYRDFLFRRLFVVEFSGMLLSTGLGIALALMLPEGRRYWALALAGLTREAINSLAGWLLSPMRPKLRFDKAVAKDLLHYSKYLWAATVVMVLYDNLDRLALVELLSVGALGLYHFAASWVVRVGLISETIFGSVAISVYAKVQDDVPRLRGSFCRIVRLSALLSTGLLGGLVLLAPEAVPLAFPLRWLPSVPIFQMLGAFYIVRAIDTTTGQLYVSVGKPKLNLYLGVVNLAVVAATLVPLVLWRGAVGAAMCLLVARLVTLACNAVVLRRVLQCRAAELLGVVAPALKALVVMAAAVCGGLVATHRLWGTVGWLPLGGLVVLGAGAYAAGVFIFERALFGEVVGLLRDALRGGRSQAGSLCCQGDCPVCGSAERRRLVTKRGWDVVRCRGCGLVYVWPQPSPEELAALYQAGGYHEAIDEAERRRYFARRLRQIEALACGTAAHGCAACGWGVPAPRPTAVGGCATRRVLDVGCSKGYFLEAARDAGWEAVGLDLNRRAVEEAKSRGLDARQGDLAQLVASGEWQGATFDVVTLFDVLEHMRDPRATLAACHEVLRPGGLLVLTTPDVGGLVPRVTYALFGRTLGAWEHPTPPGHLVQFARRTLRQALAAEGFEVVRERSEHIPLAYSVGKLENSIMDVLAGRSAERRIPDSESQIPDQQSGTSNQKSLIARFPRYVVRALSWFVIGLLGLAARATGWGDSLFVTARRAERRD